MWHGPERLGLSGALGGCGVLVCAVGHDILIFSLLCSLTCPGRVSMCIEKATSLKYNSELWGERAPFSPVQHWVFVGKFAVLSLLMCIAISW